MTQLHISSSPHIRCRRTTRGIMGDVLISLFPGVIAAVLIFGTRSLLVMAVSVGTAVLCEYICRRAMKRENSISDLSAAVTGLLLALTLPAQIPLYVVILGAAFSVVVAKQFFGGIGCNIVNPALAGRAFMLISFAAQFASCQPTAPDAVTGPTPLAPGYTGGLSYLELAVGQYGGAMGETCKIAIAIGLIYLLIRRVITWRIPTAMLGSAMLLALIIGRDPVFEILTGGIAFGAVFMATDYTTSPLSAWGQIIYGVMCGVLTVLIRAYGAYPEGTMFAILIMNIVAPLIDKLLRPRVFGEVKAK